MNFRAATDLLWRKQRCHTNSFPSPSCCWDWICNILRTVIGFFPMSAAHAYPVTCRFFLNASLQQEPPPTCAFSCCAGFWSSVTGMKKERFWPPPVHIPSPPKDLGSLFFELLRSLSPKLWHTDNAGTRISPPSFTPAR